MNNHIISYMYWGPTFEDVFYIGPHLQVDRPDTTPPTVCSKLGTCVAIAVEGAVDTY